MDLWPLHLFIVAQLATGHRGSNGTPHSVVDFGIVRGNHCHPTINLELSAAVFLFKIANHSHSWNFSPCTSLRVEVVDLHGRLYRIQLVGTVFAEQIRRSTRNFRFFLGKKEKQIKAFCTFDEERKERCRPRKE